MWRVYLQSRHHWIPGATQSHAQPVFTGDATPTDRRYGAGELASDDVMMNECS